MGSKTCISQKNANQTMNTAIHNFVEFHIRRLQQKKIYKCQFSIQLMKHFHEKRTTVKTIFNSVNKMYLRYHIHWRLVLSNFEKKLKSVSKFKLHGNLFTHAVCPRPANRPAFASCERQPTPALGRMMYRVSCVYAYLKSLIFEKRIHTTTAIKETHSALRQSLEHTSAFLSKAF
jgi:hypothetical protein